MQNRDYFLESYCSHYLKTKAEKLNNWKKIYCESCKIEINGQLEWEKHRKTRKHKALESRRKKQESGLEDKKYYSKGTGNTALAEEVNDV